ncbi:MAG TPA: HRDC domain-containing protein, partial [Planctomycetia bacterium]|nr:HRDC domain-containing protein [Planctomycetia bacterium]
RWRRISGAGGLRPQELAVLRELVHWRSQRAQRLDKPARWVLRDDLMVEMAKRQPKTLDELKALRGMGALGGVAGDVVLVVARALAIPRDTWPTREPRRDAPEDAMVLKILTAALIHVANESLVAAGLLGGNEDMKELIDHILEPGANPDPPKLAQGWRRVVCGDYIRDLLFGKTLLRIVADRGRLRLAFERPTDPWPLPESSED